MIKDGKLVWLPAVHKQSVYFIFSIFYVISAQF